MDTDNTDSKKRRGAEGGSSFATSSAKAMEVEKAMEVGTAAMEERAGNSEQGHGEEGERIIDQWLPPTVTGVQIRNPNIEIRNKFDGEMGKGKNAGEKDAE